MGYRILVRDKSLNLVGEIDTWIKLDFVVRYCQPGTWTLLIEAGTPQADLIERGGGIAVYQEGVVSPLFTGQVETFQHYWTSAQHTSRGSLYIGGKCDNKLAYQRLAFPDPTKAATQQWQATDDGRKVSAFASQAVWTELNTALGPGALADRRVPGLDIGSSISAGPTVSDSLKWDVIGAKLETWCDTKGVGYRFLYDSTARKIVLRTFVPRDLSKEIRFSRELGNLREITWTLRAPTVTRVIVACQGAGKNRYLYQQVDAEAEAEWGLKIEAFIDRRDLPIMADPSTGAPIKANLSVTDQQFATAQQAVTEAAKAALTEGAKNGNFQLYPIDTDQVKFGRDYFVGDRVTVVVDGTEYVDLIREVSVTVEDGGRVHTVSPSIGEQGSGNPLNLYKTVFEMREKLRRLEARM